MCGIAGYISFQGAPPERLLVQAMCNRLRHRGPNADGFYCDRFAAIGMRRLSVIDLSTGNQPIANEDGALQIVFNGEIYNYRELRAELLAKGHIFKTHSDTEVILHLYEDAGERAPERLNGMFAFAIWDSRESRLFVARDRVGKKPLYYSTAVPGIDFCFASELKALAVLPDFSDAVDGRAVANFLTFSYVPPPQTIYRDVRQLMPGESALFDRQGLRKRRYWQPRFEVQAAKFESCVEELRGLASAAVRCRMISDVPLGAFLSGGVDSGSIVALMAEAGPTALRTFSIGFDDKRFDELEYARLVAAKYRSEHHEQVVTPRIQDIFDAYIQQYDEPFGDPSAIPTLYLSKMTREHVTVALSGDGADEVFGGYRRYRHALIEDKLRRAFPNWFRRTVIRVGAQYYPKFDYLPQIFRAKTILGNISRTLGDAYFTSMSAFNSTEDLHRILSPELRSGLDGYTPRDAYLERFDAVRDLHPLLQLQSVDFETYLPGDILVKADRATMAYSLESRSPWLDYRLVEFAARLPVEFKISGAIGKFIQKRAMASYLPPAVLGRPKMGFSPPLAQWLRSSLRPLFESLVLSASMEKFFRPAEARRLWNEHQSGVRDHSRKLWNLLVLASWDHHNHNRMALRGALASSSN
jgi:asparagine synthase (glutamine-hydrolysing)